MKDLEPTNISRSACWIHGLSAAALLVCAGQAMAQISLDGDELAPPQPGAEESETTEGVTVSDYLTVDLFVNDEDLTNILNALSIQSQKNIIASKDVSATVTANLYGVTFYEALDAILHVNGYGYREKGNFIYVLTAEEIDVIEQANRVRETRMVTLNYLNAVDAAEFVTPLLSDAGEIKTNGDAGVFASPTLPTGGEDFALGSTLVIYDYPEHIDEIVTLLQELDTRPSQVLVEATILQTQLTEANAFGVDFTILSDVEFADFAPFGGPLNAARSLVGGDPDQFTPPGNDATAITSTPGNFNGPATLRVGLLKDDVGFFIRALDEVSDVTILNNPKILTLNRQPSRVLVGRKLGYLNTTSTETATTQTVEFLDTGTELSIRPFISNDGMVRLELQPRVSEGVIREATDATGAAVTIPDEITQELTTNVIVPDGSTIVLGGLFKESTTLNRSQVPVVGDIPIIGAAFRGHDDMTDRSEIMFLITPTVMSDEILLKQGEEAVAYRERIRVGSRMGLLPFSRDRQTAQLNVEAERLAKEGRYDKAAWLLRRSLELNPNQPDARHLQELLFNRADVVPDRSVLELIYDGEISERYQSSGAPLRDEPIVHTAPPEEIVELAIAEPQRTPERISRSIPEPTDRTAAYDPLFDEPARTPSRASAPASPPVAEAEPAAPTDMTPIDEFRADAFEPVPTEPWSSPATEPSPMPPITMETPDADLLPIVEAGPAELLPRIEDLPATADQRGGWTNAEPVAGAAPLPPQEPGGEVFFSGHIVPGEGILAHIPSLWGIPASFLARTGGWTDAPAATPAPVLAEATGVTPRGDGRLDLAFAGADLVNVLDELRFRMGVDIDVPSNVDGRVDLRLTDVSVSEALDAILAGSRYEWSEAGDDAFVVDQTTVVDVPIDLDK